MEKVLNFFNYYKSTPSDINEHLDTLLSYSKQCNHITEMGVRTGMSTWAFLYSNPNKLISYDVGMNDFVHKIISISKEYSINFTYKQEDVLKVEIEDTDLLFIDTHHTYNQLIQELKLHSKKVRKYIILHDTVSYGFIDESYYSLVSDMVRNLPKTKEGLVNAINDFLYQDEDGSNWEILKEYTNNNGLMILTRKT
jgi:hypothetical protein